MDEAQHPAPRHKASPRLPEWIPVEWWLPLAYLLLSSIWIYGSDEAVAKLAGSIEQVRVLSTYKGLAFITSTTLLIHLGLRWTLRRERAISRQVLEAQRFGEQIIQSAEEGILVYDLELRFQVWNPFMERLTGKSADEVRGARPQDLFPMLEDFGLITRLQAALEGTPQSPLAFLMPVGASGESRWLSDSCSPLRDAEGRIIGVISILRDTTETRRAEQALAEAARDFRQLAESMPQIVWICDAKGQNTYFNQQWVDYTGMTMAESHGDGWNIPFHPDDKAMAWETWRRAIQGRGGYALQCRLRRHDGVYRWWLIRGVPHCDPQGTIQKWFGTCTDIHDIRQTKEDLRVSQEKFHKAFHAAPMLMALSRLADGSFIEVNAQFCRITGFTREEVLGRSSIDLGYIRPETRDQLKAALGRQGRVTNFELTTYAKSGIPIQWLMAGEVLELDGEPVLLSMATDITERQRLERQQRDLESQLQHLQRLEAVGKLTSGVSHDMNNVLSAIMGVATVMKLKHSEHLGISREADILLRAAQRGRDLVLTLRDFSRRELGEMVDMDLNDLVRHEVELLERTTLKKVDIAMDLEEGLPPLAVEVSSLGTALMNLCVNACDAMPQGGTLTLATRRVGHGFLELSVQDQGEGMSPEVLERATEPFFTTKPAGRGTGLGLSQVAAAAKAHGGTVEIRSEPGLGTRIALVLPLAMRADGSGAPETSPATAIPVPGHRHQILLVDDDEMARIGIATLLRLPGHDVFCAESGPQAIHYLETGAPVDFTILDLSMPGMDGLNTLGHLRRLRPTLPVLIATGFADDRVPALLRQYPDVKVLHKPFGLTDLQQALATWPIQAMG